MSRKMRLLTKPLCHDCQRIEEEHDLVSLQVVVETPDLEDLETVTEMSFLGIITFPFPMLILADGETVLRGYDRINLYLTKLKEEIKNGKRSENVEEGFVGRG